MTFMCHNMNNSFSVLAINLLYKSCLSRMNLDQKQVLQKGFKGVKLSSLANQQKLIISYFPSCLRTVSPFFGVYTFCTARDSPRN